MSVVSRMTGTRFPVRLLLMACARTGQAGYSTRALPPGRHMERRCLRDATKLIVCVDAPSVPGVRARIGWVSAESDLLPSAPPPAVVSYLSMALTQLGMLSFLTRPESTPACSDYERRILTSPGWASRVTSMVTGIPSRASLVSTRDARVATRLFYDPHFIWERGAQIVLLGAGDARPPRIDRAGLIGLLREGCPIDWAALGKLEVSAVLRALPPEPVVSLSVGSLRFAQAALAHLEHEAGRRGFCWERCSEETFGETLRYTRDEP